MSMPHPYKRDVISKDRSAYILPFLYKFDTASTARIRETPHAKSTCFLQQLSLARYDGAHGNAKNFYRHTRRIFEFLLQCLFDAAHDCFDVFAVIYGNGQNDR